MASTDRASTLTPGGSSDWSEVPVDAEQQRMLFGRRLAFFAKVHFLLGAVTLCVNFGLKLAFAGAEQAVSMLWTPSFMGVVVVIVLTCGLWLACRKGERSARFVSVADAVGIVVITSLYSLNPVGLPGVGTAEVLVVVLGMQASIVLRAIIVPSRAIRTLWTSAIACVPPLVSAFFVAHYTIGRDLSRAFSLTSYVGMWSAIIVACATLASRVIYGLHQRVRDATRIGQYLLEEKVGEGGMGVVYRARHVLLKRPTAIKLLPRDRAGENNVARFEREVQHTSQLTHPNTIKIFDYGRTDGGAFYYAMEYLDGFSLEEVVDHDGPLPPGRVVGVLGQVAGALAEAHAEGLMHRDIKPGNLHLDVRGRIADFTTVLDFGLVKPISAPETSAVTGRTALIGTPLYMAPECIVDPDRADASVDLYALGAVAYWLLTGTPPFDGANVLEVCSKHLHETPEPPSSRCSSPVSPELDALVLACLAKTPEGRPRSALELQQRLHAVPDARSWKSEDAERWWKESAPRLRERLAQQKRTSRPGAPRTLGVALEDRVAS